MEGVVAPSTPLLPLSIKINRGGLCKGFAQSEGAPPVRRAQAGRGSPGIFFGLITAAPRLAPRLALDLNVWVLMQWGGGDAALWVPWEERRDFVDAG